MNSNIGRVAALVAAGVFVGSPARADLRTANTAEVQVAAAGSATTSMMDHQFVMKAARGGNAEISLGRLALQKSTNAAVKSFAHKMIRDHTAAGAKLASIVAAMGGAALPPGLSATDAAMRAKLASLSGAAFDASYLKGQVAGHQKMAALMQKEASQGANSALKQFATATLPTVQMHLAMAQKNMGKMSGGM